MDKGMFPVLIYKYIKENSDEEKCLTPEDIYKLLRIYTPDIQEDSTWKTVSRNLEKLAYQFEEIRIVYKNGFEYTKDEKFSFSEIESIYYDQKFTTNDVRVISDAVIYSRHLNDKTRKELLGKIAELRPSHSNGWYSNALQDSSDQIRLETDLFHNLEYIDYAINDKLCINFEVMSYDFDKKLHPVESHEGFTPYKIYISDGIYYVVGLLDWQKQMEDHHAKYHDREAIYPIRRFPIHRLKSIRIDDSHEYVEIEKTILKDKSLKEICEGEYNEYNRLRTPATNKSVKKKTENNDVTFMVSRRGLNVLTDIFGKRISVQHKKEIKVKKSLVTVVRTDYRFEVVLKNVSNSDWKRIITLMMQYTEHDLALLSHHETMNQYVVRLMSHNVKTLS